MIWWKPYIIIIDINFFVQMIGVLNSVKDFQHFFLERYETLIKIIFEHDDSCYFTIGTGYGQVEWEWRVGFHNIKIHVLYK